MVKIEMAPVQSKIEELCLAIVNQTGFKDLKNMVDAFMVNEEAIGLYNQVAEKQQALQQKQNQGQMLTEQEVAEYEAEEMKLYGNEIARQFMYAQNEFSKVHDLVSQYVIKSIELDRLPTQDELSKGSCGCGGSCGCSH